MTRSVCPECGRKLKPNARFCSYCGVNLDRKSIALTSNQAASTSEGSSKSISDKVDTSTDDSMPPALEAALILRGKLETLQVQRIGLDEDLETLRVKQLVGELDEGQATKKIGEVQNRFDLVNKEIESLKEKAQTPIETLHQEQREQQNRIQRLEDLRETGEVEQAIYQRLASEYHIKLREITQHLETEFSRGQEWLRNLEIRKEQLEFDRETLQVRARIDDVTKREVKKQLKTLDDEITKITRVVAGLRAILGSKETPNTLQSSTPRRSLKDEAPQIASKNQCSHCGAQVKPGRRYCLNCGNIITS